MILVETVPCMYCRQRSILQLDLAKVNRYVAGEHVQSVWPEWNADQREMMMTGTHPQCWATMFPQDEEE